jgi:dTMP kinase
MYLFMAARAQLVREVIAPALAEGRLVIADRYHDSTLAYQGGARGLEPGWPQQFPRPQLTFLLMLPPELGLERGSHASGPDRLESESLAFHRAVADAYERLAAAEPDRFVRLDATQPVTELHEEIVQHLSGILEGVGISS